MKVLYLIIFVLLDLFVYKAFDDFKSLNKKLFFSVVIFFIVLTIAHIDYFDFDFLMPSKNYLFMLAPLGGLLIFYFVGQLFIMRDRSIGTGAIRTRTKVLNFYMVKVNLAFVFLFHCLTIVSYPE